MVVFVDFGEESGNNDDPHDHDPTTIANGTGAGTRTGTVTQLLSSQGQRPLAFRDRIKTKTVAVTNTNGPIGALVGEEEDTTIVDKHTQLFTRALACYPIASSIASHLDLNTLHALSLTCSSFRRTLLPFRPQLVTQTLRCSNDTAVGHSGAPPPGSNADGSSPSSSRPLRADRRLAWDSLIRAGPCARDMVGGCRRCGTVVCRNCTTKPLSSRFIKDRVRRLCATCVDVPIQRHLSTTDITICASDLSTSNSADGGFPSSFTSSAFARDPCTCEETVWLCHACGGSLHSADVTYKRVWTWRSRYSTHIGGLGTGMGEGDQGQKCGKGASCAEATEIEMEIDCSTEGGRGLGEDVDGKGVVVGVRATGEKFLEDGDGVETMGVGRDGSLRGEEMGRPRSEKNGRTVEGPGYLRQEIEGIGGVVKKKVKKRVRVGATVQEFEDERESGRYLEREEKGLLRCWCGWCDRVVPESEEFKET